MVIVAFKPKTPENDNAFCSAAESKQNSQDRTLGCPSFFVIST